AKIVGMSYEAPVPPDRRDTVAQAIAQIHAQDHWWIERDDGSAPRDLKADLQSLELVDEPSRPLLRFRLAATHSATVRPREVLQAVGLSGLEIESNGLTRTC